MWRYRARITLEHLAHVLQQNISMSLKILKEFLRLVSLAADYTSILNSVSLYLNLGASIEDYTISSRYTLFTKVTL